MYTHQHPYPAYISTITMDKLEDSLYQAIVREDQDLVALLLSQGASPNKTTRQGKTCLGEAANIGNIGILIILIDNSLAYTSNKTTAVHSDKKRQPKSHKRKLRHESKVGETVVKYKSLKDRSHKDVAASDTSSKDKNLGYFIFVHSDGSSSDESRVPGLKSPLSPVSLMSTPQGDLEWDEDIGSAAPTTSEDETWTSLYRWYASILESTGVALATATMVSNGIDQQDAFMRTALHYAAEQGHTAAAKLLIDAGCKVDIAAGDGLTPLHVTAMRNHIDTAKVLLASGSHVNYKTHEKMTPLHFAASRGYLELVKLLVAKGAYLEARDTNERTPLYLAAGRGHSDVVKCLISYGAHVNSAQIHGYTPLCEAVWQRYPSVVEALMLSGARITHSHHLLHNAIIQRQEEIVRMLAVGGGVNLHNDNGDTPLHIAARLSLPKIARVLLQKGAQANCANSITGANALHIAVESVDDPDDFEELLKCLLQYNIDMNWTTLTGDTALNRALLLERDTAAILLIRYGSDSNASDLHSCGLDNLAIASRRRSHNLANILLKAGHEYPMPDTLAGNPAPGTAACWLQNACRQPLSLLDICRIKIRSQHGSRALFQYVSSLPLPKCMIRFLMMEDEG